MPQTFVTASDDQLIQMIQRARARLVVVLPALTQPVADAVAERMDDLPDLALTVVLDADAEVYRLGYGDTSALDVLRKASAAASYRLREEPGIRIGLVISDDRTLVFSPVSRNIEAGARGDDRPNGILLGGEVTEALAAASGAGRDNETPATPEIGRASLDADRVQEMQRDLERTPPLPVDLTRKLNVFVTRIQYVELKAKGYQLSRRRAALPSDFSGMSNKDLKERVSGRIKTPVDGIGKLPIKIEVGGKTEALEVDESFLQNERHEIEQALTHVMPKRGRVILRQDRASFDAQIRRFEAIIDAYQKALVEELKGAREGFRQSFVDEFLERWKQTPPKRFARHIEGVSEEALKRGIENEADRLFDHIVKLDGPDISVVYKDIAIEDLRDESFMAALREVMAKGGVRQEELDRLFEQGQAAPAQESFKFSEAGE